MRLTYEWNRITVNSNVVELPAKIAKVIIFDDFIIALLHTREDWITDKSLDTDRNIFGINTTGEVVWQIETPSKGGENYNNVGIERGTVKAVGCIAYTYDLDPVTGKISNPIFTK